MKESAIKDPNELELLLKDKGRRELKNSKYKFTKT